MPKAERKTAIIATVDFLPLLIFLYNPIEIKNSAIILKMLIAAIIRVATRVTTSFALNTYQKRVMLRYVFLH